MPEQRLRRAEERVKEYLTRFGVDLASARIAVEPGLGEETLATHRYPGTVVVRDASVAESVIAHELVHIAQGTLEQFRGFRLLHTLLAEGLAEWVAKTLYPEHEVKYGTGYRLVGLLAAADEGSIGGLFRLSDLPLDSADVETTLASPYLTDYSRDLLTSMADQIRESVATAVEAGITDPTFVPLGEELRAWKFLLDVRYQGVWNEASEALVEWSGSEHPAEGGDG